MNHRITRLYTCTLVSLTLLGFAVLAAAQSSDLVSRSPNLSVEDRTANQTQIKDSASAYNFDVLYNFCAAGGKACTDGANPYAGLFQDSAGNFYGVTGGGGTNNSGTVFKLDTTGKETVLYNFCSVGGDSCTDGTNPYGLIEDSAGNFYGITGGGGANLSGTVFKLDTTGKETVLYNFCSVANCADGFLPHGNLVRDSAGNLYGATDLGGANGGGAVFKVDTTGHETVIYSFCSSGGSTCTDGDQPAGGLIRDSAGNLYGTTFVGGAHGGGVVFRINSSGQEMVLHNFCSMNVTNCTDGNMSVAGLIRDSAGNLYGTTSFGGKNNTANAGVGGGTVFKVDATNHETVLYSFCSTGGANCTDGNQPEAGLFEDSAGNLYGTTVYGGANTSANGGNGGGTVFRLDTSGIETVLYSFCSAGGANCTDGNMPVAGLIRDGAGNLYSTTSQGGTNNVGKGGGGTVFKLLASAGEAATITLTSSLNPSFVNQSVTFSVVVSGSGTTPTGSVTFEEGSTVLGTETLVNGQASFTVTIKKSGNVSIVASYSGDQNYKAANSSPLTQVVDKPFTTSTALASSLNPSTYGQAVGLTATVSSAGPTPTGTVTFRNGSASLGSATLSGGVAKITTSKLPAGTLTLTATYGGNTANAKSVSSGLTQVVNQANSKTSIVSSVNPSNAGQTVKFTATVTSATTTPTGTVKFNDGSTELGTGTLAKGKASFSTSTLSAGSHKITAVYEGTANTVGSTSPALTQTVN